MRMGWWGSFIHFQPGAEGDTLVRLGLLSIHGEESERDIQATERLRAMFHGMPSLEALYPLLVEFVMGFEFWQWPGFVDHHKLERRLLAMGMSEEGLDELRQLVAEVMRTPATG